MKLDIGAENIYKTFLSYIKLNPHLKNSKDIHKTSTNQGNRALFKITSGVPPTHGEVIVHVCLMKGFTKLPFIPVLNHGHSCSV